MQPARRLARPALALLAALVLTATTTAPTAAQAAFSIADVLSPGFPYSLVSADAVDRIAWIENERGMRNVYTAEAPGFEPLRLTDFLEDDGIDLQDLQISRDGEIVTFLRGHAPNREGGSPTRRAIPGAPSAPCGR
jgi:dipeptidyl-peptidase 4